MENTIEGDISNPLDWNQYVYCRNNPVYYVDLDGNVAISFTAALIAIGFVVVCVGGVYMFKKLQELSQDILGQVYNSYAYKRAISTKISANISWALGAAQKTHILRGSKNTKGGLGSTHNHADIWRKFNIDPNNNNDWSKLLPILKTVVDTGHRAIEQDVYEKGKLIGKNIQYLKVYADKGISVVVRVFTDLNGKARLSDAWGVWNNQ